MKYFVVGILLVVACVAVARELLGGSATEPADQLGSKWWKDRHEQKLKEAAQGGHDLVFIGDSITQGWEGPGREVWKTYYGKRNALNLGYSGDMTDNVLWRLQNGELKNVRPKLFVVMIGTNNSGRRFDPAEETAEGIKMIVEKLRKHSPKSNVLLLAVFPRDRFPNGFMRQLNVEVNEKIRSFADGKKVHWLDLTEVFLDDQGVLPREVMPDGLHPGALGYQIWAEAMEPSIKSLMK